MDSWQKSLYEKLKDFIGDEPKYPIKIGPVRLGITEAEAYILMKALESQEKATGGYCGPGLSDFINELVEKATQKELGNEG